MAHFLQILPILILASGLLQASVGPTAAAQSLTFTAPALTLTLDAKPVPAGESQTVQVELEGRAGQVTVLVLTVTYPNGETERTLHSTQGNLAEITWVVPAAAGTGEASFRLSTQSCGCGDHSTIPAQPIVDTEVAGTFQVIGLAAAQ